MVDAHMAARASARLRADVLVQQDRGRDGRPVWRLIDTLTKRSFTLPEEAEPLLMALRQGASTSALASELAATFDEEAIERLVGRLRAQHLLEDASADAAAVQARVREGHRAASRAALARALGEAASRVPFYRTKFGTADLSALAAGGDLSALPRTTRDEVRANYPDGFVPEGMDLEALTLTKEVVRGTSSGTSAGDRVQTVHTREAWRRQMMTGAALNDDVFASIDEPNATFTTMHCADPDVCVTRLADMRDRVRGGARLLLLPPEDPGAPTPEEIAQTLREIREHGALWLDCNPSYLAAVSFAMADAGVEAPKVRAITTGFEFLSAIHRRALREVWGCGVFDRYSASELGNFVALECERGNLHVNDACYFVEIAREGRAVRPGELGTLVVSALHEPIALLRYETSDLAVEEGDDPCPCGSPSRRLRALAGRRRDALVGRGGRPLTPLEIDTALAEVPGLRFYQVHQTSLAETTMKVVSAPSADANAVCARARDALAPLLDGASKITARPARRIYPERSGKFRFTKSDLLDDGARGGAFWEALAE